MVDLTQAPMEDLRPVTYARKWWIPRNQHNKPVSPATVYRWAKCGIRGVRLKLIYSPSGALTSQDAVREFLKEVDRVRRQAMAAEKCIDATDDELSRAGLLPSSK